MFRIENNMIWITKGDTAVITVELVDPNGEPYEMVTGDKLVFTAKKRLNDDPLFTVTTTTNSITLSHNNTKLLEPPNAYFDIELQTASGNVNTIAGVESKYCPNMIVYPEVTENG